MFGIVCDENVVHMYECLVEYVVTLHICMDVWQSTWCNRCTHVWMLGSVRGDVAHMYGCLAEYMV